MQWKTPIKSRCLPPSLLKVIVVQAIHQKDNQYLSLSIKDVYDMAGFELARWKPEWPSWSGCITCVKEIFSSKTLTK